MMQATDAIKVGDVLQFRLPDDSTASINGVYRVGADGSVELSGSGKVQVAGKTLEDARKTFRDALAISYAVQGFELNPCEYYMVRATANGVQKVLRVPLKEGTTVKDALRGAPSLASKVVWIARPTPGKPGRDQVLTVDWDGISRGDRKATNYALQSGDYIFVADEPVKGMGKLLDAVSAMLNPDIGHSAPENYKPVDSGS
jgi:protein involved in polysaccharide export with SLBB domain